MRSKGRTTIETIQLHHSPSWPTRESKKTELIILQFSLAIQLSLAQCFCSISNDKSQKKENCESFFCVIYTRSIPLQWIYKKERERTLPYSIFSTHPLRPDIRFFFLSLSISALSFVWLLYTRININLLSKNDIIYFCFYWMDSTCLLQQSACICVRNLWWLSRKKGELCKIRTDSTIKYFNAIV